MLVDPYVYYYRSLLTNLKLPIGLQRHEALNEIEVIDETNLKTCVTIAPAILSYMIVCNYEEKNKRPYQPTTHGDTGHAIHRGGCHQRA